MKDLRQPGVDLKSCAKGSADLIFAISSVESAPIRRSSRTTGMEPNPCVGRRELPFSMANGRGGSRPLQTLGARRHASSMNRRRRSALFTKRAASANTCGLILSFVAHSCRYASARTLSLKSFPSSTSAKAVSPFVTKSGEPSLRAEEPSLPAQPSSTSFAVLPSLLLSRPCSSGRALAKHTISASTAVTISS